MTSGYTLLGPLTIPLLNPAWFPRFLAKAPDLSPDEVRKGPRISCRLVGSVSAAMAANFVVLLLLMMSVAMSTRGTDLRAKSLPGKSMSVSGNCRGKKTLMNCSAPHSSELCRCRHSTGSSCRPWCGTNNSSTSPMSTYLQHRHACSHFTFICLLLLSLLLLTRTFFSFIDI